ncbi:MAG: transporter, partial [Arthrobacter sp.]|nr:transporter [Arthrobacter sp.]
MTNSSASVGVRDTYNPNKLFNLSVMALVTAAWVFGLRASIMGDLGTAFGLTGEQVGGSVGLAFLAFGLSIFVGSPLLDILGMGRLLGLACVLHIAGILLTIFSPQLKDSVSPLLLISVSQFTVGLAHGLVEAVINPLAASIYPDNKTHKLNVLHAWWPGGIAIAGVIAFVTKDYLHLDWQMRFALALLPAIAYGFMLVGQKFPPTERAASNVSNADMFKDILKPAFLILLVAMACTASLELGPAQWIDGLLKDRFGFNGILVLVYVNTLMFGFRFFAGTLAHKFSPIGLMWISCLLAGLGLLAIGYAQGPVMGVLAATLWGVGVCYMWPTMLGITSERFPRSGALGMGLIGGVGSIIINFGLKEIGAIYDRYTQAALPAGNDLKTVMAQAASNPEMAALLKTAQFEGAPWAFRWVAVVALLPLVVFAIWWMVDKKAGGYKAVKLVQ